MRCTEEVLSFSFPPVSPRLRENLFQPMCENLWIICDQARQRLTTEDTESTEELSSFRKEGRGSAFRKSLGMARRSRPIVAAKPPSHPWFL
jgi:hypothetical protein